MMPWISIGLALLLSTSALLARQDREAAGASQAPSYRRITVGRALLPDGKAWSGAEVFLLHRPLPQRPGIGRPDLIRVTASPRGRFRAQLLERRPYMVWARSKDEKGRYWVSEVRGNAMAGQPIKLLRRKSPSVTDSVVLSGGEKVKTRAASFRG